MQIIIRFAPGQFDVLQRNFPDVSMTPLYGNYAVALLFAEQLTSLMQDPLVTYIEPASPLFFAQTEYSPRSGSCLFPLLGAPNYLDGSGIVCGVIDSGIDLLHPIFQTPEGETRFLAYWDQQEEGTPPSGYPWGQSYTQTDIQDLLSSTPGLLRTTPWDATGHGTAVAGIIAQLATGCRLIGVRLGRPSPGSSFPLTSELMLAVNYVYETALAMNLPLVLNLSFGNAFGAHDGTSLLETYLDEVATLGRSIIVVGTGNEGSSGNHVETNMQDAPVLRLQIAPRQTTFSLQIWKNYADEADIVLLSPDGTNLLLHHSTAAFQEALLGNTILRYLTVDPTPYSLNQLIFITFSSQESYVAEGIWQIRFLPRNIKQGLVRLWLPSGDLTLSATRFLEPTLSGTLTIPSTANRVLSVGAYVPQTRAIAGFSGRGFIPYNGKPDLVAPGENIRAPIAIQNASHEVHPGAYAGFTGTSFATPIVSGTCALLMQQGLIQGADPNLYGEKLKAVLRKNATPLYEGEILPNHQSGYGALCGSEYASR